MKLCSFSVNKSNEVRLGTIRNEDGVENVVDLSATRNAVFGSFHSLILEVERSKMDLDDAIGESVPTLDALPKYGMGEAFLRIPLVPPEVWGAGVTYIRSRDAREVETSLKGLYSYVYDAERPEIFFKTTGLRCVGPDEEVSIRSDSKWTVPEPELTLVLGENCNILGYTIGNDMSARDIEGLNPLYLPQAKIFNSCCALGPVVATAREIPNPRNLMIKMRIYRGNHIVFDGSVSTTNLKRSIDELVSYLARSNIIPMGSVFMTGTGIVPPDDFSLKDGDIVEIEIEGIGKLRNMAKQL